MGIYLRNAATEKAVRKLAKLRGTTLTEAIASAVNRALEDEKVGEVDDAAVDELIAKVASWPKTGLKADKEFYDSLYED